MAMTDDEISAWLRVIDSRIVYAIANVGEPSKTHLNEANRMSEACEALFALNRAMRKCHD